MPTSDFRHPHYETAAQRDQREAREEIRRSIERDRTMRAMIASRRVLPDLARKLPA